MRSLERLRTLVLLCVLPAAMIGCAFDTSAPRASGTGAIGTGTGTGTITGTGTGLADGGIPDLGGSRGGGDLRSSSTTGSGNGQTSSPSADANCGASMYGLQMLPPDVLIVLDRSTSMNDGTNNLSCAGMAGCQSKWAQVTPAVNQVVSQTAGSVRWGLTYFPSGSGFGCTVDNNVSVPVADNAASAIMSSISGTSPNGLTPTAAAVNTASTYLAGVADPNPKYILLATDGQPNCASSTDPISDDTTGAVKAVTDAKSKGIGVFVVGISTSGTTADSTLNQLAKAGGYPQSGTNAYYPVSSTADLVSALGAIAKKIASGCSFPLGKVPPAPDNIGIYADGTKIPRDPAHANGWDYNPGMTAVTIYGPTCDALMAGQVKTVQAFIGCGVDIIP
jgi:hypothetical protein